MFTEWRNTFGHFDKQTRSIQIQEKKRVCSVVNMCNAVGLIVPSQELATGYLIIGRKYNFIENIYFDLAEKLIKKQDSLIENYFLDYRSYFSEGYTV